MSTFVFSQDKYEFDYLLTYKSIFEDSTKTTTKQFLTNSKDNAYFAMISDKSKSESKLHFTDHRGLHVNVFFDKTELAHAEQINIICDFVLKFNRGAQNKTKHYQYINYGDQKIELTKFDYTLTSINPRRAKRKKLGTYGYILNDSIKFHLPLLITHLEYEEFLTESNIPNGIFKDRSFTNYQGQVEHTYQLIKVERVTKVIIIPSNCKL